MEESWSENRSQSLLYTKEFLESCFQYPGASFTLAPTIYYGEKPAGFVAGFPRVLQYQGKRRKVLVVSLLTVAPAYKKMGYGVILWSALAKRARDAGFDGMVNYCIDGEAMNSIIVGCCQRLQLPVERVYSIPCLFSILWPRAGRQAEPELDFDIVQPFIEATAPISRSVPLARLWTPEEAKWQCTRAGAVTAYHQVGHRHGILTGYVMKLADANRTCSLLVEDVLWGTLEAEERIALVKQFTGKAAARGASMAIVPVLGYADMEPFRAARFRASPRILHTYFTLWNGSSRMEAVPSFYLDVF